MIDNQSWFEFLIYSAEAEEEIINKIKTIDPEEKLAKVKRKAANG